MTDEQDRIMRENNAMLREIIAYIRKIQSPEYRDKEDVKQFCINVSANIFVDSMDQSRIEEINSAFKK